MSQLSRLEKYTEKRRQEVILLTVEVDGTLDQIAIFRGFSSSLVRSTSFDPDVPLLPDRAEILQLDRLQSPYDPGNPVYIEADLTWESMQTLLEQVGV